MPVNSGSSRIWREKMPSVTTSIRVARERPREIVEYGVDRKRRVEGAQRFVRSRISNSLAPPLRGEGRGEGYSPHSCARGESPSPGFSLRANPTSPRKRGEVRTHQFRGSGGRPTLS